MWSSSPVDASHNLIVVSQPPEAIRLPVGLKLTLLTSSVCPWSVRSSSPVAASHNLIVLSPPAEAIRVPSGLKLTL